jgi:hypothetical protein
VNGIPNIDLPPEPIITPVFLVLTAYGPEDFEAPMTFSRSVTPAFAKELHASFRQLLWTPRVSSLLIVDHLLVLERTRDIITACHRIYTAHRPLPEAFTAKAKPLLHHRFDSHTSIQGECLCHLPCALIADVDNVDAGEDLGAEYEDGFRTAGEDFYENVSTDLIALVEDAFRGYDKKPKVLGIANVDGLAHFLEEESEDDGPF